MAGRNLFLGAGKLTIADLMAAMEGARVVVDDETLQTLSVSVDGGSHFVSDSRESDPFLRASLVVRLHTLLKAGDQVRCVLARGLLDIINSPSLPTGCIQDMGAALLFSSNEVQAFLNTATPHVVSLSMAIGKLQTSMPLFISSFALFLEAFAISHNFLSEELYTVSYRGLKATLQDLESLLENSKMVKNSLEGFGPEVIEVPQALGYLRDALDTSTRIAEAELNEDLRLNQKLVILHSLRPVNSQLLILTQAISGLIELLQARLQRLDPNIQFPPTPSTLHDSIDLFLHLAIQEIALSFALLQTKEAKMNEGVPEGKGKKQLPYGKGTKQLVALLTACGTDLVPQLTSGQHTPFIVDLLQAKNEERRVPKIPKGMRDYGPAEMSIRSKVFNTIRGVFLRHQAGELDTPVMELKETLTGKYGEEGGKLIYELADQGGEILALRYDLTVPLARYVAMNRITRLKRFHIGKVYRRDQPQLKKGRYREFYQCDFDVVGAGALMIQEAECLKILSEILLELNIPFLAKVNHRRLLDACLEIAGCPPSKFRTVSSSIDKLDKEPWEKVREELISEKGVSIETADIIGELVKIHGPLEATIAVLQTDARIQSHAKAPGVLQEMQTLAGFLKCLGVEQYVEFDLSLARGLDYYTGLVYEAVVTDNTLGLGSIGGGGRYDELIQKLNNSKQPTPAVGISLGIERLFTLVEKRGETGEVREDRKGILIAQAGRSSKYNLFEERLKLCCRLWESGLSAETSYKEKSDPDGQARYADEEKLSYILWLGESELDQGVIKVKDMLAHSETLVPVTDLIAFLRR